jgi:plastocyanin
MRLGTFGTLIAAALLGACGGGSSSSQGNGSCTPGQSAGVAIASTGVSPKAVCVLPGGTVTFTNGDTVAHDMEQSGSVTGCSGLNLGSIAAGQAATAPFPAAATCTFEDAGHATDDKFHGTVAVSSGPTTGPGY